MIIQSADDALAAIAAAKDGSIQLESPPAAAASHGLGWWQAILQTISPHGAVLDCGPFPGHALAALRAGIPLVRVDAPPEVMAQLQDIARHMGARVLEEGD